MNSIVVLINLLVLIIILGGWIFLLIASWRSMKALESISITIQEYREKKNNFDK